MSEKAPRVRRIDCRESFPDLFRGGETFRPFDVLLAEAKKFANAVSRSRKDCWSATAETSASQDRSAVRFARVMYCLDRSADFT